MLELKTDEQLLKYKKLSILGGFLVLIGIILGFTEMIYQYSAHLFLISIIFLIIGWFIFSINHTKIAINTLPLLMQPRDSGATEHSGQNVILAFGKPHEKIRVKASECPYCQEESYEMRAVLEIADMIMCPNCGKRYPVSR